MTTWTAPGATLERLHTGSVWTEGPLWIPSSRTVRWSDIPNNRILAHDTVTGETHVHSADAEYANGRTLDLAGRVVQCSHGRRAVEREVDGTVTVVVDRWEGGRFNSPNDVVVAADGAIWFTDPPYGIVSDREGRAAPQEYGGCHVFRHDEATGEVRPVVTDMVRPNGLAFSPDESVLYVSDTAKPEDGGGPFHIRAYDVADGRCAGGRVLAEVSPGCADGFRVDTEGRIWTSTADSVQVLSPDGAVLGVIPVPEVVSNLCFGGDDGHDLYITATSSLYRIRVTATQAPRPGIP